MWSVLLYSGKVPPKAGKDSRQSLAKKELATFAGNVGMSPADKRPERVERLFQDGNKIDESYS
jgi:hypothetical protein